MTCAPPTPNGGLHVGHLSGPYLAADVYTRVYRILGDEVVFVSYSDEYQSYLKRKEKETHQNLNQIATQNYKDINLALSSCDIELDCFSKSKDDNFFLEAVDFFRKKASDYIFEKEDVVPYCENCNLWGFEGYAKGKCNYCHSNSDRSQCETCASPPEITGIEDLKCTQCKKLISNRKVTREYLNLNLFYDSQVLLKKRSGLRKPLVKFVERMSEYSNLHWPIDRPGDYGIPCITAKNKILSTWFAGVAGYFAATKKINKQHYWNESGVKCAFFVGFDCSFSHALVYPTLLEAANLEAHKNLRIYTNAFLKLDGVDFSTSRGIAIWANDLLEKVNSDYVRFYLALVSPEELTASFNPNDFCDFIENDFCEYLNFLINLCKNLGKNSSFDRNLANNLLEKWQDTVCIDSFSMKALADFLLEELKKINTNSVRDDEKNIFLSIWSVLAYPLIPNLSKSLLEAFGLSMENFTPWLNNQLDIPPFPEKKIDAGFSLPSFDLTPEIITKMMHGI